MTNFIQPKGSDNLFTIEMRYGDKLTLYYYDPVERLSRPIAYVGANALVHIPLLGMQYGVDSEVQVTKDQVVYHYPDFGFLKELGVKVKLINRQETYNIHELNEIYLHSIAKNFDKMKTIFESKWMKKR